MASSVIALSIGAASWPCQASETLGTLVGAHATVRKQAAEQMARDASSNGLIRLWLLAHDPEPDVVGSALKSALVRCRQERFGVCLASLRFFMDSETNDEPDALRARISLLAEQPALARAYASRETKLDVVALLAGRVNESGGPSAYVAALEQLARDPEPDVQEAAGAILLQLER